MRVFTTLAALAVCAAATDVCDVKDSACRASDLALHPDLLLERWRLRVLAEMSNIPPYPTADFSGRGIVLSAGGRGYFTSAYVALRVLRDVVKTSLPIEVFYVGPNEIPAVAIEHMWSAHNVRFIDVTTFAFAAGANLQGFQIKPFAILLSSFAEVVWMDADNIALQDPALLFEASSYVQHGAIFWPDLCNMVSFRREAYIVAGLPMPWYHAQPLNGDRKGWLDECDEKMPREFETGQIVLDKRRSWKGLMLAVYLNRHHEYFYNYIFAGDKMSFYFAFRATNTPFHLVPFTPQVLGLANHAWPSNQKAHRPVFCGNTLVQRDPDTGLPFFLHRMLAKYAEAHEYVQNIGNPIGWSHLADQEALGSWGFVARSQLPPAFFLADSAELHAVGLTPFGLALSVTEVDPVVSGLELRCLAFLRDLEDLPFFPRGRKCTPESMFFCVNA